VPEDRHAAPIPESVLQDAASMFGLLAATVRLHLLWVLASGEQDVGTLAEATGQSLATVSHHLGKLKLAGLVRARRDGKRQVYVLEDSMVKDVVSSVVGQRLQEDAQSAGGGRRRRA
jgi:DNA-binding transcriptional ArsR family regulator